MVPDLRRSSMLNLLGSSRESVGEILSRRLPPRLSSPPSVPPRGETTASVKGHVKIRSCKTPLILLCSPLPGSRTTTLVVKGHGALGESSAPMLFSFVPLNPGCRLPPSSGGREGSLEATNLASCKGIFIANGHHPPTDSLEEPSSFGHFNATRVFETFHTSSF